MSQTMSGTGSIDTLSLSEDLIKRALTAGADAADVVVFDGTSVSAACRLGAMEEIERSEGHDLGLRVFVGQRQAVVSSNDLSPAMMTPLAERCVAMAKSAPEDPYCGLAPKERLAQSLAALDLEDQTELETDRLYALAKEAEDAARSVDGVTNSNGGHASWGRSRIVLATSDGFARTYGGTSYNISCSVVAANSDGMETDYDSHSVRHFDDLTGAAAIGTAAANRAIKALSPRKVKSTQAPVVFDPRVSRSLIGHFLGAISGSSVARGSSFLKDKMGQEVFGPQISIIDDPHRRRGLRSKPFDGEGVANKRTALVESGVLKTWLLDSATARQLGLETTGHAARGTGSPPGPSSTNVYMEAGSTTPEALISDITQGFYVTGLIGHGVNGVTGDYSRGANGFWIENGEIAFPVSELTIAGNLKEMFRAMTPADDLELRYGVDAPTIRVEGLMIAGA